MSQEFARAFQCFFFEFWEAESSISHVSHNVGDWLPQVTNHLFLHVLTLLQVSELARPPANQKMSESLAAPGRRSCTGLTGEHHMMPSCCFLDSKTSPKSQKLAQIVQY